MRDIHHETTEKVVRAIESGLAIGTAWTKPWHAAASSGLPINHVKRCRYRGMDVLQLWFSAADCGYEHGLWLTYRQALAIGAQVRRGEKGTRVIKFGQFAREDEATGGAKTGTCLQVYSVFNIAQCDGIEPPQIERPNLARRIDQAEQVLHQVGVPIHYSDGEALYRPSTDTVHMPQRELFRPAGDATATEMFYSVAFHEVGHATGT